MPDQTEQPPKRMTTAEVAALAQQIDGRLDDLGAVVTDLATRLQDIGQGDQNTAATRRVVESMDNTVAELAEKFDQLPNRDQVDGRIHEALQPLHEEVHELRRLAGAAGKAGLENILARLEEAERKAAGVDVNGLTTAVSQQLHPALSDLRQRLAAVEEVAKGLEADPVSHTLAEDALADQIEHHVDRKVQQIFAGTGVAPAEIASTAVALDNLKKRVNWVTDQLADLQPADDAHTMVVAERATRPFGAGKKVLDLMRRVTSIGKEQEANLGERGGRFMFRGVDQAMDAVGHAMREVGVILSTEILDDHTTQNAVTKAGEDRNGRKYENTVVWTTTKLRVRYTFVDPEDGSSHSLEMVGEGRDASDKSTSKAASMALKYGLFQALMIPVTGLDDSEAAPPQYVEQDRPAGQPAQAPASQAPADQTDAQKATRAGEALGAIRNVYRVPGGAQAQHARLLDIMGQVKSEGLLGFVIEGSTLDQHGRAAMATLQAPPPPDDARASTEPPEPPEEYR